MKISPVSSAGQTVGAIPTGADAPQTMSQKVRNLKMSTNATPGYVPEVPPQDPALTIPDPSSDVVKTDEETQPLSPQFAALAKQRRALQQEKQALDREKAEFTAKQDAGGIDLARLKSDPIGVLQEIGIGYEQLTEAVLNQQNGYNPEIKTLKDELAALKAEMNKTFSDKETQQEEAALNEIEREVRQRSSQGDDFELIRATRSEPKVRELVKRTYKESGEILDVGEAMKLIEDELLKDNLKLANLKKIQSQFAPASYPQPQQQQRQMRTLTNRDTASIPMTPKQRALAAFAGTLKK